jgi:hypothetical protein
MSMAEARTDKSREMKRMGIDFHGLRLLQYAASKAPFKTTATLGR